MDNMSGRVTPNWGPHSPSKYSPVHSTHVGKSPLSPFRYNEDSLRILASDIEANKVTIPLNLPVDTTKQIGTLSSQSRPQTPRCYSRRPSLPTSSLTHSPLQRNMSSPVSIPPPPSYEGLTQARGGGSLGTPARTMRDYDESLREIKKENFNLKLRIFFLEERLALGGESSSEKLISTNIDLKVQLEACKQELSEKFSLLVEASEALEHLDTQMKTENYEHKKELNELNAQFQKTDAFSSKQDSSNENKDFSNNIKEYLSNEHMVLEVLEELEEFSEKEKDFENKYNKKIQELKLSSEKTEEDLNKIKLKLSEYEDEIESLNSNLDAKNEFITALENKIEEKSTESQFLVMQLEKSGEVIKDKEEQINSIRRRQQTDIKRKTRTGRMMKNKGINTETNQFTDIIKHLEDEILFKNQEIQEFQAEIKIRDVKIGDLEQNKELQGQVISNNKKDELVEMFEALKDENKKLDDQLKLHSHERKNLLKKINMLKDQIRINDPPSESIKIDDIKDESMGKDADIKQNKDVELQCDLDKPSVLLETYKSNLSRYRKNTLSLRKKLTDSIESLKEFRKSHDKFVHMVEVIVNMDDMNINDEISNLVSDTRKTFEIDFETKDALLEDLDCLDSVGSFNIESLETLQNFQTCVMQYLRKETKELNKKINENYSFIFSLEDELLMKDALTDGQSEIINDLKNNYGQTKNRQERSVDLDSRSELFETSFLKKIINPISYTSNQSVLNEVLNKSEDNACDEDQEFTCSSYGCLAEEKDFLIDLLDVLKEEIESCENIDSGVELDYDAPQKEKDGKTFNFCRNCSSCIQRDMYETLKQLHYGLPSILDQIKKLNTFYENLREKSKKVFSESERKEKTLNDYHVLIAKLTSENLKLTGERLVNKSEAEEIQKRSSKIIRELEDEISTLNSQLADKEVEILKAKTSPPPRAHGQFFDSRISREDSDTDCSDQDISGSFRCFQSPKIIREVRSNSKQHSFYNYRRPSTKLIKPELFSVRKGDDDSDETTSGAHSNLGNDVQSFCFQVESQTDKNNWFKPQQNILDSKKSQNRQIKKKLRPLQ